MIDYIVGVMRLEMSATIHYSMVSMSASYVEDNQVIETHDAVCECDGACITPR